MRVISYKNAWGELPYDVGGTTGLPTRLEDPIAGTGEGLDVDVARGIGNGLLQHAVEMRDDESRQGPVETRSPLLAQALAAVGCEATVIR